MTTSDLQPTDLAFPGLTGANGWYLKTDSGHSGPMDSVHLKELLVKNGDNPLVCQRGFSRWYLASEVSAILERSLEWDKQAVEGFSAFQKTFLEGLSRLTPPNEKGQVVPQEIQTLAQSPVLRPIPDEVAAYRGLVGSDLQEKDRALDLAQGPIATSELTEAAETLPEDSGLDFIPEMPRDYFLFQGRLRLGKLRRPWLQTLGTLITGGLTFPFWASKVRKEVFWHLGIDVYRERFPGPLRFLPVLHVLNAGFLARDLRRMELQNGYKATSVSLAVALALIPPLYVLYVQKRLNRHWLSHVRHALREGVVR